MQPALYDWLVILGYSAFVAWSSFRFGKIIPNGEPVAWHRHHRVKEGHKYWVLAIVPSRLSLGLTEERCAILQDEFGLYNPFEVFFPPAKECNAKVGQLVQPIYQDSGKFILYPVPPHVPLAC